MHESIRAFCSDSYVNQKLTLKMDLPSGRETSLSLFERLRRSFPSLTRMRRSDDELELEATPDADPQRWVAIRTTSIRSGTVNAASADATYALHRAILELSPYYLGISALDIESLELLYGFDLPARGNHDRIVAEALLGDGPLASLLAQHDRPIECQPMLGFSLAGRDDTEAFFEIKTRPERGDAGRHEPISVYVTVRRNGPFPDTESLLPALDELSSEAEELVGGRALPALIAPLHHAILSGPPA